MNNVIKIKCPYCSSVLSVKCVPGMESKSVTCPICKKKTPFLNYRKVVEYGVDEPTQYPDDYGTSQNQNDEKTVFQESSESGTQLNSSYNLTLGRLKVLPSGVSFQLRPGRNVVGRKATQSTADFQIPIEGSKRLSREHLVIEVKKMPGKGFVHYASLYKERSNNTFIGNEQLEYGDCVVLNTGDIIKLPDVNVKFEICDSEETETDF